MGQPHGKAVSKGTHRAVSPEQTWSWVTPMLPAMGITRVADVTGLDVIGIPVWQAIRPNGRTLSVSQGKGITHELARVSGVMEAIETWHAEEARTIPAVLASVASMVPQLSYSVFDLPRPKRSVLCDSTELRWILGHELGSGEPQWVPQACVVLDATDPMTWTPPVFEASSNGLASGNTLEEALLHALYEAVERDCIARRPDDRSTFEVDPATVCGSSVELLDLFAAVDVHVRCYDITVLQELPCYEAEIWSAGLPLCFRGYGCHRDPDVALSRALTEAAQSRLGYIAGARDDINEDAYRQLASRTHLRSPFPAPNPSHTFPPAAESSLDSLDVDLGLAVTAVGKLTGNPVLWVDLSRPEYGIPVVQVITPGLTLCMERVR